MNKLRMQEFTELPDLLGKLFDQCLGPDSETFAEFTLENDAGEAVLEIKLHSEFKTQMLMRMPWFR